MRSTATATAEDMFASLDAEHAAWKAKVASLEQRCHFMQQRIQLLAEQMQRESEAAIAALQLTQLMSSLCSKQEDICSELMNAIRTLGRIEHEVYERDVEALWVIDMV